MELRQLEYLVAVVEESSFSAAARRMGVRQPSISEQIAKLERQLRQPLLDRLKRGVTPTPAGRQLVEHARRILAEVSDARRQVGDAGEAGPQTLAIGAIPTIAPFLMPRLLQIIRRQQPDAELTLVEDVTAQLALSIERGELDLAVISTQPESPTLLLEEIREEPLLLMAPASHPLARRRQVRWRDLAGEQVVALHEPNCLAGQTAEFCQQNGLNLPVVVHGSSLFTVATLVAAGMGISLAPQMMARQARTRFSGVVFRPFASPAPRRVIHLLWNATRYRTRVARACAQAIQKLLTSTVSG